VKVTFLPLESTTPASEGDSLLFLAQKIGATWVECCGMNPLCGKCKVSVVEGEESLTTMRNKEFDYAKENGFLPYQRLGCLACIQKDDESEVWVELENYVLPQEGVEKWHKENLES